ncbi:MAG TPA: LON peptidase substrate-binding domain-containing protein [Thermoanaerobaculia bacterium]|nr:LON peptidase substrate-binding domain-containing protein [Thermoanaerobaculia bacterium]
MAASRPLLPLFPLPGVVFFPETLLPLHIFEPRYRAMVADLLALPPEQRLVGITLLVDDERDGVRTRRVANPGTAGRLVRVDPLPDGRYDIVLRGAFRIALGEEVAGRPYRQVRADPLFETEAGAPPAADLREGLLDDLLALARSGAADLPVALETARALATGRFSELVNRLASGLELPAARRQLLLTLDLPARAGEVAAIVASRRRLLDSLAPFRHLAGDPLSN